MQLHPSLCMADGDHDRLANSNGKLSQYLCKILDVYFSYYHDAYSTKGVYLHDPTALLAAVNPSLITYTEVVAAIKKAIKYIIAEAVVPAIDVMYQALSEFGAKIVPPKRILKMLPELFDHLDQNVRASSRGFSLEPCRRIGKEPVKSILFEKMWDTMKKELEAELVNVSGTARPSCKISSSVNFSIKLFSLSLQYVIILYGLFSYLDHCIDPSCQVVREKGELTKLASTKRIAPGDFTEIWRTLKKMTGLFFIGFGDSYSTSLPTQEALTMLAAVAVEAIQAIGNLARGLRTHFSRNSRFLLPILLTLSKAGFIIIICYVFGVCQIFSRILEGIHVYKDRGVGVVAVAAAVVAWWLSNDGSADLIVEWWLVVLLCRVDMVKGRRGGDCNKVLGVAGQSGVIKWWRGGHDDCSVEACLNDGTPEVRDAAFSAVAKLVGMRPLEKSLEKLDDVRKKEAFRDDWQFWNWSNWYKLRWKQFCCRGGSILAFENNGHASFSYY
ncbi:hypothetical protein RHGRI_004896 [Rhododendron griersonianum]|uniref:XMAP215/Dis1/CLASP TOG domain-containing protein n=1 Tax=Rhododendron griersonianum TaxID=479676 RepID=A0AAV6LBJ5_9ERIC|nr:hypothetical protein RHGRI_004896 [Rhododendron griersonianum]